MHNDLFVVIIDVDPMAVGQPRGLPRVQRDLVTNNPDLDASKHLQFTEPLK